MRSRRRCRCRTAMRFSMLAQGTCYWETRTPSPSLTCSRSGKIQSAGRSFNIVILLASALWGQVIAINALQNLASAAGCGRLIQTTANNCYEEQSVNIAKVQFMLQASCHWSQGDVPYPCKSCDCGIGCCKSGGKSKKTPNSIKLSSPDVLSLRF